jgi:hypothetical protein
VWGGAKEQDAEREAGNWDAKNWQDEARKVLERTVRLLHPSLHPILLTLTLRSVSDGTLLEGMCRGAERDT